MKCRLKYACSESEVRIKDLDHIDHIDTVKVSKVRSFEGISSGLSPAIVPAYLLIIAIQRPFIGQKAGSLPRQHVSTRLQNHPLIPPFTPVEIIHPQ